jgi:hypothetical protein
MAGVDSLRFENSEAAQVNVTVKHVSTRPAVAFEPSIAEKEIVSADGVMAYQTPRAGLVGRTARGEWQNIIDDTTFAASEPPQIYSAELDRPNHLLLIGTRGQGWNAYDTNSHSWLAPHTTTSTVRSIMPFRGQWWIASDQGLDVYEPQTRAFHVAYGGGGIRQLVAASEQVFAVTDSNELVVFEASSAAVRTLIPASQVTFDKSPVKVAVTYKEELWLGMSNGELLAYNQNNHRLRRGDSGLGQQGKRPSLISLVAGSESLWAVLAPTSDQPGQLFCYSGDTWRPVDTGDRVVTRLSPIHGGVIAQTNDGSLIYYLDGGTAGSQFFSGEAPVLTSPANQAFAVASSGQIVYAAASEGPDAKAVFSYDFDRHTWSKSAPLLDPIRIKELHDNGALYAVTVGGGLIMSTPSGWRNIIAESGF